MQMGRYPFDDIPIICGVSGVDFENLNLGFWVALLNCRFGFQSNFPGIWSVEQ
jgi:hypothetical protein